MKTASILDTDVAGVTAKSQSQTFAVGRFCLRGQVEAMDAEGAELDPVRVRLQSAGPGFGSQQG